MSEHYILDGHNPVPAELMEWAAWYEKADRRVAVDQIGVACVSTVFLGLDHSVNGPVPILFETLVFGGPLDGEGDRYPTWDAAVAGHAAIVEKVKAEPPP